MGYAVAYTDYDAKYTAASAATTAAIYSAAAYTAAAAYTTAAEYAAVTIYTADAASSATAATAATDTAISGSTAAALHYPFASGAVAYAVALGYDIAHYAKASYHHILGYAATAAAAG